jgi:predicted phosphodiesterase
MNGFIVIGDTHGNFRYIMNHIKNFDIRDTTLLHVGDFGIGFQKYMTDKADMRNLNRLLTEHNCQMYVIRGNHDNPYYFDGTWDYTNLHLVPDYTVITVEGFDILMVGGAISIDRKPRLHDQQLMATRSIDKELYWFDEEFVLDEEKLKEVKGITYVVTHTCPHFVDPINNQGIPTHGYLVETFATSDPKLKEELDKERQDMTKMYEILKENNYIAKWFYGHFHRTNAMYYEDTDFVMLGINEFRDVRLNVE